MNPVWTIGLGWTLAELQAKPFLDFVHPDDRATTLAEVGRLAEGAETLRFENRYRHRDGSYRWLRWSARSVPVRQEIYATARDVTQRKRLEREVLEVVDREKERLGRELHDGLCQTLAGIAALSESEPGLAVCGEAATCRAALDAIRASRPDLVIVDLVLEGCDGLDLIKDMKTRHPQIPALVLSMHDEAVYAERSLRAGARGYVTKQKLRIGCAAELAQRATQWVETGQTG